MNPVKVSFILGLVSLCRAMPQGYSETKPDVELAYTRTGTTVRLPNGDHLDDDCIFLTNSETVEGSTIEGEYSYLDPTGSLVEVHYTVGTDGSGYNEMRRIVRNKIVSSSTTQTNVEVERIVSKIIVELRPTVVSVIRSTVQSSNINDINKDQLVMTIVVHLRPVVFAASEKAVASSTATEVTAGELTDLILVEITPLIEEGVQDEVTLLEQQEAVKVTLSVETFVKSVIDELRSTVVRVIKESVAGSSVADYSNLAEAILVKLKVVVLSAVQSSLSVTEVSGNFDVDTLTDMILNKLRPFVEEAVQTEVSQIHGQAVQGLTEDEVVRIVITELRPTIISVIRTTVSSSGVSLENPKGLVDTILVQLEPVVLRSVTNALSISAAGANFDAQALTQRIITEIRTFVEEGVEKEIVSVQETSAVSVDVIVETVIRELRPTVVEIIRETVRGSSETQVEDQDKLIQEIVVRLKPVVLAGVKSSEASIHLDADDVAERIIIELKPFIIEGVRREVRAQVEQQRVSITSEQVVEQVIAELRPTVIRIVKETVSSSTVLDNPEILVQTILVQVKPVVLQSVESALSKSSLVHLNAGEISGMIISQLKPVVEAGVQKQITHLETEQQQREEQVVRSVIEQLHANVVTIIRETVEHSTSTSLNNPEQLVERILIQLRPVVLTSASTVLNQPTVSGDFNAEKLTEKILSELRPFVFEGVTMTITEIKAREEILITEDQVVKNIIDQLRPTVVAIIRATVESQGFNTDNPDILVESIMVHLRAVVQDSVDDALKTSSVSHLNANSLSQRILVELRPFVEEGVRLEIISRKKAFNSSVDQEKIILEIVARLRPLIVEAVNSAQPQATVTSKLEISGHQQVVHEAAINDIEPSISRLGSLTLSDEQRVINNVVAAMTSQVKSVVQAEFEAGYIDEDELVERILTQLTDVIAEALQDELGLTISTTDFNLLMEKVLAKIRFMIAKDLQALIQRRSEQDLAEYGAPEQLTGADALTSIFGVDGKNFVRVESTNYNYNYETNK